MSEFYDLLASIPDRMDDPEACRAAFLEALGYDPDAVSEVDPEEYGGELRPIAEGLPVVDADLPMARRFVLRVGPDPMEDPPVPVHPEEAAYPSLEAIHDELDVEYVVQVTDHRLILYSTAFTRTYVLTGGEGADLETRPTYEPLTPEAAGEVYDRLAVDASPDDQSSIADY